MAPAVIVGVLGLVASAAGTAVSIDQQVKGQKLAKARAGEQRAQSRRQEALVAADRLREHRRLAGKQTVLFAKAGVDLTGTPLDVRAEAEKQLFEDLDRISSTFDVQRSGINASETAALQAGSGNILATVSGAVGNAVSTFEQIAPND